MSNITKINFGEVGRYVEDKGFGFVNQSFHSQDEGDVFFHIKTIKRSHPEIAKRLDNGRYIGEFGGDDVNNFSNAIFFWYKVNKTSKGMEVKSVIDINDLSDNEVKTLCEKIESIWKDKKDISNSLIRATENLLGVDRTNELRNKKKDYEIEEQKTYLKTLKEESALRKNGSEPKMLIGDSLIRVEIDSTKQRLRELKGTESKYLELIENEYKQIIEEMKPLGFTRSKDVSYYIIENKLGEKYKNISGIVKMEKKGDSWDFKGGFPPKVYKRICEDLNLENEGSNAKAIGFDSYSNLYDE